VRVKIFSSSDSEYPCMSQWHVYVVQCCDESLYVGISTDVLGRVKRHNAGKGAAYTRSHRPVELVWTEAASSESAAKKREAEMKKWSRAKKVAFVQGGEPGG